MVKIYEKVDVSIEIAPYEMGRIFASMHSDEQAQFFDGIASEIGAWDKPAGFQWQHMWDELENYPRGLKALREIAEYAP
jgi:hypothetical protein